MESNIGTTITHSKRPLDLINKSSIDWVHHICIPREYIVKVNLKKGTTLQIGDKCHITGVDCELEVIGIDKSEYSLKEVLKGDI